jgi:NADH-quinone oxidoreductase subunit H
MQSGGVMRLDQLVAFQQADGAAVSHLSGVCALLAAVFCMQAKLTLVPFDIPEAETEIIAGPYTDYSGPPLALFKLMRNMMLFVVPMTLIVFLCGAMRFDGVWSSIASILKFVGLLVIITLMRNTNPRLRIDQAIKFFWTVPLLLALAGIALASFGW